MSADLTESDGPETVWARAHEQDLIGLAEDDAAELVTAAGFQPVVFRTETGHAVAAMQVSGQITLISAGGVIRRVRV